MSQLKEPHRMFTLKNDATSKNSWRLTQKNWKIWKNNGGLAEITPALTTGNRQKAVVLKTDGSLFSLWPLLMVLTAVFVLHREQDWRQSCTSGSRFCVVGEHRCKKMTVWHHFSPFQAAVLAEPTIPAYAKSHFVGLLEILWISHFSQAATELLWRPLNHVQRHEKQEEFKQWVACLYSE